jgi:hypothetical protein
MKYFVLIVVSVILITSCEKKIDSNEVKQNANRPDIPPTDSIDINSDHVIDFVISYNELATADNPSSGGSIIGSINPLDENQLLYRNLVGNLFLSINDTIRNNNNNNSIWNSFPADLIAISRHYENWDKKWNIISDLTSDYFLAYKLKTNDSEEIGWILLNFNLESGEVTILDKEISNSEELIIQL